MSPLRVLRGLVFGGLGGLLGWALIEFLPPPFPSPPFRPAMFEMAKEMPPVRPQDMGLQGLVLGLAIGAFLGLSEGIGEGTRSRFLRAFWVFTVSGAIAGFLGLYMGQQLYTVLGGGRPSNAFLHELLARSLGWTLIGLFLGVGFGMPNLSLRRMWNGAIGGAIGGFLGGFFFQTLREAGLFQGIHGRLVGFALMGALIGFFINLIAEAMKQVWVKVLVGRNEGREHVLDTPLVYVGRDELAEVPVFLDPAVPKRMASFRLTEGRYALYAESNALPILVNGEQLQPGRLLKDGDAIQFGRVTLAYNEKASATGVRAVDSIAIAGPSPALQGTGSIPAGGNVCEFCGQARDASGACACSVPADAAPVGASGYAPTAYAGTAYGAAPADAGYAATVMDPGVYAAVDTGTGPRLIGMAGPFAGQVIPLMSADIGIGREPTQDIALVGDTTSSRRHARLGYDDVNGWVLRDQGSANGTWVNGVRVQEQPVYPGDMIRIGHSEFRFEG